jgi:hypothetical protein
MDLDHRSVKHYSKYVVFQDGMEYDSYNNEEQAQYVVDKYNHKIPSSVWTMRFRCYSEWEVE